MDLYQKQPPQTHLYVAVQGHRQDGIAETAIQGSQTDCSTGPVQPLKC